MQKALFVFNQGWNSFILTSEHRNNHGLLLLLTESLRVISRGYDFKDAQFIDSFQYAGIEFYYDVSQNQVNICYVGSIKKKIDITEMSDEEYDVYYDKYEEYYDKRYAELPKLVIMGWHWQDLEQQWKELLAQKSKYMIMQLDDDISPHKITMIGKDELSVQDLDYFQKEHEKYLKYQQARQKYIDNHPDYSDDVWRGPQDDEYETDYLKYYQD